MAHNRSAPEAHSIIDQPVRRSTAGTRFPIGIFEDAGLLAGNLTHFEVMANDVLSHSFDSVMFTNNFADRDEPLLDVADERGLKVYMLPGGDLNVTWWPEQISATMPAALDAARPIVNLFRTHASFAGYIVKDEPNLNGLNKTALITHAFQELDPDHPAAPILIGVDRVGPIFAAAQPDVMLIDVYPVGYDNPPCDFTMTGFGYSDLDFVGYVRRVTQNRPATTPLWIILQTHNFLTQLRQPLPTEVRAENWLAIGEGATGIFWFIYSSQQGWTGLVDNQVLYEEVTRLARRIAPFRDLLLGLEKSADRFTVTSQENSYVSTLVREDVSGIHYYVVAVNRDCENAQPLTIHSSVLSGQLQNLEDGHTYNLGEPILFAPGDGKILELVNAREIFFYVHLPIILHSSLSASMRI